MTEDFDLLAGHGFGEGHHNEVEDGGLPDPVLLWQNIETQGYQPSAREVRSKNSNDSSLRPIFVYKCNDYRAIPQLVMKARFLFSEDSKQAA